MATISFSPLWLLSATVTLNYYDFKTTFITTTLIIATINITSLSSSTTGKFLTYTAFINYSNIYHYDL